MTDTDTHSEASQMAQTGDINVIEQLRQKITGGTHWYVALLEAIGKWSATEETYNERTSRYLIGGEAFDLLQLAERLCQTVADLLPETEITSLLFYGQPPLELLPGEFKKLIGNIKHHQYLNYFYGITVEEALLMAVLGEIHKERLASGYFEKRDVTNEAFQRIYGSARGVLLRRFRRESSHPHLRSTGMSELKEFTYWLFNYRIKHCEKARVASDTRKALKWLETNTNYHHLDGSERP